MANGTQAATLAATDDSPAVRAGGLTVTERNFLRAGVYTAIIVFVFWCGWYFERSILHRSPAEIRFIREASEAAMRYITIPHIVIGFLFLVSSRNNRSVGKRLWTGGLLLAGAALCAVYWKGGGKANLILYSGVYFYFLVHELRDEAMFYCVLGDAAPIADKAAFKGLIRAMTALIVLSIMSLAWAPLPFGVYFGKLSDPASALADWSWVHSPLVHGSLTLPWQVSLAAVPLLAVAAGYAIVLRHYAARLGCAGPGELVRVHGMLFRLMFGVAGVLGLALLLTQRAYALILFHVVAWYIFAAHQFGRHPPKEAPRGWWPWMRSTVKGFKTLHIGMVVILMAVGLVWTLALDRSETLAWLLEPESFLYWTIMHITVSFVPR